MAIKMGDGYFNIENPSDDAIKARYRKAIIEALTMFEDAIKLTVKAHDVTGLQSIKDEASKMFQQADKALKQGTGGQ